MFFCFFFTNCSYVVLLLFLRGLLVASALVVLVFRALVLLVLLALVCCRPEKYQWFNYKFVVLLWPNWNKWQIKWWQSPAELLFLHAFGLLLWSAASVSSPVFLAFCLLVPLCFIGTTFSIFPAPGSFFSRFSYEMLIIFLLYPNINNAYVHYYYYCF